MDYQGRREAYRSSANLQTHTGRRPHSFLTIHPNYLGKVASVSRSPISATVPPSATLMPPLLTSVIFFTFTPIDPDPIVGWATVIISITTVTIAIAFSACPPRQPRPHLAHRPRLLSGRLESSFVALLLRRLLLASSSPLRSPSLSTPLSPLSHHPSSSHPYPCPYRHGPNLPSLPSHAAPHTSHSSGHRPSRGPTIPRVFRLATRPLVPLQSVRGLVVVF